MHVHDRHARDIARPVTEVFADIEALGTPGDRIWPAPSMPFERTPGPLRVGVTQERHGIVRAVLEAHQPGQSLVWRAQQWFLSGTHGFAVSPTATGCRVEHVLDVDLKWWFAPVWRAKMGAVHDRIVEGLLDRLQAPDR